MVILVCRILGTYQGIHVILILLRKILPKIIISIRFQVRSYLQELA
jgi:hypothetical protein